MSFDLSQIDWSKFEFDYKSSPIYLAWVIFIHGGWIAFIALFIVMGYIVYLKAKRRKFWDAMAWQLLAINVPMNNEQNLLAVEQIFAMLHGIRSAPNFVEMWIKGEEQLYFSLEIVSIEGYIHFLVRTPAKFRDLVESAFYAHYSNAEITEVADYASPWNLKFPNAQYDIWGAEYVTAKSEFYPIRTWPSFEHSLSQSAVDPMASLLEVMSKIGAGEQMWFQFVITPVDDKWKQGAANAVRKIIGMKVEKKANLIERTTGLTANLILDTISSATSEPAKKPDSKEKKDYPSLMQFLAPGEKNVAEAIELKAGKIGFKTKIRYIYLASAEVFSRARGVSPILGGLNQFNTQNLNALKSAAKTKTKVDYFRKWREPRRKRKIMKYFKDRDNEKGMGDGFVLNVEELASLFHFPSILVTAPTVKKTQVKKAEPPVQLPTESGFRDFPIQPMMHETEEN
ncbi:MAG: hypothetical protein AAB733_02755, partial [Patescibacteria group bacterium]